MSSPPPRQAQDFPSPYWAGRRVLVTGATGFIGSRLTERLGRLGAEVHAVSRRPPRTESNRQTWHRADTRDAKAIAALVRSARPDVVFHLASEVTGARDLRLVLPTMESNLAGTVNVLAAVADSSPARVVSAGSIEEPGTADPQATPSSPYAMAKWASTSYARMFHQLWGLPVSVLRVAMVYGPGQQDTAKLVPYVALCLLRAESPRLTSGDRLVDWVYVDDVVDAFLAAGESERTAGRILDICSGRQVSIRNTVRLLASVADSQVPLRFGALPDRALDHAQLGDPRLAAELLDWRAATALEDGLRETVSWYAHSPPNGGG